MSHCLSLWTILNDEGITARLQISLSSLHKLTCASEEEGLVS